VFVVFGRRGFEDAENKEMKHRMAFLFTRVVDVTVVTLGINTGRFVRLSATVDLPLGRCCKLRRLLGALRVSHRRCSDQR
jgi:hypothetical protein